MIFLFVIPAIPAIFGNFFLPIQLGTDDVFFPRLNLFSWYLFMLGGLFAIISLFVGDGFPDTGWTFYVPFSAQTSTNVSLAAVAVFVLGFSSILTGLNFVTTIHRLRTEGMTWMRIPLFTWSLYATAWIQILATPVIGITVALLFAERVLGTGLFYPAQGGDPIMFQHLFWIYSRPAVYIMVLPGMGVVSDIIPVFSRKPAIGYKAIVVSSIAIAFAGSLVWAHHMYTSGMSDMAVMVFSFLTFIVAIPAAIKVFNWLATLYEGSILLDPPLLYALSFILLFTIGGLTGLVLGAAAGGGLPQWNCGCPNCIDARAGKIPSAGQSSLAVSLDGKSWSVLNASPDIRQQMQVNTALHPRDLRDTPLKSILLTNGDIDHIAGLLSLREQTPFTLFATHEIQAVLTENRIFDAVSRDKVDRLTITLGEEFDLQPGLEATVFPVPGHGPSFMEGDTGPPDPVGQQNDG